LLVRFIFLRSLNLIQNQNQLAMSEKIIITAALTGVLATRQQSPHIPYSPVEIAEEGLRAVEAGASILHIHARQENGFPAFDVETYAQIDEEVKKRCPEVIINYSTGAIGIPNEQRIHHIDALKPDMAALNMGSMNYAIYSRKHKAFYHDHVFANPFKDIAFFLEHMKKAGTRAEMECFDTGHINNAQPLIDMGLLEAPLQFSLIMGVLGGIPATTENLVHQVHQLPRGEWLRQPSAWGATCAWVWKTTCTCPMVTWPNPMVKPWPKPPSWSVPWVLK
jgi:3-keto-5-aminohexanoate cleavage enzyme